MSLNILNFKFNLHSLIRKCFLFIFSFSISAVTSLSQAENLVIETYLPAPIGAYDHIKLRPSSSGSCNEVTIILNEDNYNQLTTCGEDGPDPPFGMIWNQAIVPYQSVYLTDSTLNVGIGTSTPELKLTLANDAGLLAHGTFPLGDGRYTTFADTSFVSGTRNNPTKFLWYPKKASLLIGSRLTHGSGGEWSDSWIYDHSLIFGNENNLKAIKSVIAGGKSNLVGSEEIGVGNVVLAGNDNVIMQRTRSDPSDFSILGGGSYATSSGDYNFVGNGGVKHGFSDDNPTVPLRNLVSSNYSVLGGGGPNEITHDLADFQLIGGGAENSNISRRTGASILGGQMNTVDDVYTVVGGGFKNSVNRNYGTVWGGRENVANQDSVVILGGELNEAEGPNAVVAGGFNNHVRETSSVIGGGEGNYIVNSGNYSVIGGGYHNYVNDPISFLGGGQFNQIWRSYSAILGGKSNYMNGRYDFIGGGERNQINAEFSAIVGGKGNIIRDNSNHSLVAGENMVVEADSPATFLWGFSPELKEISGGNKFIVLSNVVGMGVLNPEASEARLHVDGNVKIDNGSFIIPSIFPPSLPSPKVFLEIDRTGVDRGTVGKDLAEIFETVGEIQAGDVLVFDNEQVGYLRKSASVYDKKVVGVASKAPAILLQGSKLEVSPNPENLYKGSQVPVALHGKVYCNVSLENGPIEKGDLLTTSSLPGYAMKATDMDKAFNSIVGKSLEDFDGGEDRQATGKILMIVTK